MEGGVEGGKTSEISSNMKNCLINEEGSFIHELFLKILKFIHLK